MADDIIGLISFIEYQVDKGQYSSNSMRPVISYLKEYLREVLNEEKSTYKN